MDRIHRLGQHRPVQAIKLVVEDSIESRIVQVYHLHSKVLPCVLTLSQLQEKKSAMVDATLSTDDSVSLHYEILYGTHHLLQAMGRLTPEDLGFLFRVSVLHGRVITISDVLL
jgi:DNA repair protein RAD16